MAPDAVNWSAPFAVLGIGLLVGFVFVWRQLRAPRADAKKGEAHAGGAAHPAVRDLVARRDALIQQLRDLEDTAAKRTPAQLAGERYALELEAARVLREIDRALHVKPAVARKAQVAGAPEAMALATPAQPAPAAAASGTARGFLWGVGTAAAIGALVFFVSRDAKPRETGAPVTGELPQPAGPGPGAAPPADEREAGLRAALERNPDDFDARIALAQALLGRQDMMGVWNETQYVLQRKPGHPRALAYQALVRIAMGQAEMAVAMLREALATDPNLLEAHIHLALAYRRQGRDADAERVMKDTLARFPTQRASLEGVFEQIRRDVSREPATASTGAATGGSPTTAAAPPATAAGRSVSGVIELDPALAGQAPAGATLFLMVREARLERGPPAAVKRISPAAFPLRFELSDADSMAGEPLPDPLRLEVRLDADGNAMTRDAADPVAVEDGVRAGASGLRLVLRRR